MTEITLEQALLAACLAQLERDTELLYEGAPHTEPSIMAEVRAFLKSAAQPEPKAVREAGRPDQQIAVFSDAVKEAAEDGGYWGTCSGCHQTFEGYETGEYPFSEALNCYFGCGCGECGGLGAVWNTPAPEPAEGGGEGLNNKLGSQLPENIHFVKQQRKKWFTERGDIAWENGFNHGVENRDRMERSAKAGDKVCAPENTHPECLLCGLLESTIKVKRPCEIDDCPMKASPAAMEKEKP